MLNEDGVAGEVAMDDGRFTGVQVAVEKRKQTLSQLFHALKATFWALNVVFVQSPESRQDLRAPAFPSLLDATRKKNSELIL